MNNNYHGKELINSIFKVHLIFRSISIPNMSSTTKSTVATSVDRNLEEEAKYLESEYNNTMSGNYTLVEDYGSTSDVDKE